MQLADQAAAIRALPALASTQEIDALAPTGTDAGATVAMPEVEHDPQEKAERLSYACQGSVISGHDLAPDARPKGNTHDKEEGPSELPQPIALYGFDTVGHSVAEARPAGFEPAACGLEVRCSIH